MSNKMFECEVKNFTAFLEKCLKRTVIEYTMKPLTQMGDNYGSVLHSVEAHVTATNDNNEVNLFSLK